MNTRIILLILIVLFSKLYAANEPLRVGLVKFAPPFVMQDAHHNFYGFDVEMMGALCHMIRRQCSFHPYRLDELIPALETNQVDVIVSELTITTERSQRISFTIPYLRSRGRFLALAKKQGPTPFTLDDFIGKTIGVIAKSAFVHELQQMHVKNMKVEEYDTLDNLITGLSDNDVDAIIVDNPTALYWAANSAGLFTTLGQAFNVGQGVGIGVNKNNTLLLQDLNEALTHYLNSSPFEQNYQRYLGHF
jgi:polar amino acid transport system substrate-binding protein